MVIRNGKLDVGEMRRNRLTVDELRCKGYADPAADRPAVGPLRGGDRPAQGAGERRADIGGQSAGPRAGSKLAEQAIIAIPTKAGRHYTPAVKR